MTELEPKYQLASRNSLQCLAQPSLRVVLHCFGWKCSWGHPLSIFEEKIGGSLGSSFLEAVPWVFGLKLLPKPSPIHIWNENGGLIRVRYLPNINWPPWTASKKPDPNEHPIFSSNMDRGWLQEHFHLKQCMYKFKDGWARDQISIGLQKQPQVSSSVIFEFIHTLFWV